MRHIGVVVVLALLCRVAVAQPAGAPPPPGTDMPAPPAPPASEARARYDAAFDALLRGDVADAVAGFATVAEIATDPRLQAQASELYRLAHELALRDAHLTFGTSPGASPHAPLPPLTAPDAAGISEDDAPDGGRASFVVSTTMASFYTGIVAIDVLNVSSTRTGVLLVMGSTAGGVIGSIYGTKGHRMTAGMASAWFTGLYSGAGNALLLSGPIGFYDSSSNRSEKVQTLTLASMWGAGTAGLLIADKYQPTAAQVNITGMFGVMGLGTTLASLAIIQPNKLGSNSFLTIMAVGLDGGLALGAASAGRLDWSKSRVSYVGLSAFLGVLAGGGTSLLIFTGNSNSDQAARASAAITLAGMWGGFALGMHLTRDMAPDYRFRAKAAAAASGASATITPTILHQTGANGSHTSMPGLALVGQF